MLFSAIFNRSPLDEIVRLASYEESLSITNYHGNTPLHHAVIYYPDIEILKELTTPESLAAKNFHGDTPLHTAVFYNRSLDVVKAVIHPAANVRNHNEKTPLHIAAERDNEAVAYLLDNGFDPDALDVGGNVPLHYVRSADTAVFLLTEKAIATKNKQGYYPINTCLYPDALSVLAEHSCDDAKNTRNKYGYTPLITACKNKEYGFVEKLVTKENEAISAYEMAQALRYKASPEVIKLLYRKEIHYGNYDLTSLALSGKLPLEVILLFFNEEVPDKDSLLTQAIEADYSDEVVSFLADHGKCTGYTLTKAMTASRYSTATIAKLSSREKKPIEIDESTTLDIIKLRGKEALRYFAPPQSIAPYKKQELLEKGYSQESIDSVFAKSNVVENDTCFCCLIDFETGDEITYLSCDHCVHSGCYKQAPDESLRCFCGNRHFITETSYEVSRY